MIPYATYLRNQDPMEVLSATAQRLHELAHQFGDAHINQPIAPGKWSPRELFIHLADCDLAFGFRYRQALGEENHLVQPFDQDRWAKSYAVYDAHQAIQTFAVLRNWNLTLLRSVTPEQMSKPMRHPERGSETFHRLLEINAGHDINHLQRLEAVLNNSAA